MFCKNIDAKQPTVPHAVVRILRCGGCHAALTWEALELQQQRQQQRLGANHHRNRHLSEIPFPKFCLDIVWDDGDGPVHPALKRLRRVRSKEECIALIESRLSDLDTGSSHSDDDNGSSTTPIAPPIKIEGYIAVGSNAVRSKLVDDFYFTSSFLFELEFPSVIHPKAFVSPSAVIGHGCFIGPMAIVHSHARVGNFCLINSASIVEHDCRLDDFVTVSPGAVVLGCCNLGYRVFVGANATIREHTTVQASSSLSGEQQSPMIGMGAAVVHDIVESKKSAGGFWAGVPAKFRSTESHPPSKPAGLSWCCKKDFSSIRFNKYIQASLNCGQVTNGGPLQEIVQKKLQDFVGSKRLVRMACNGTSALHALVAALELQKKTKLQWVTQAFTFPSCIQGPLKDAIVVDIDPSSKGPCLRHLEAIVDQFDGIVVTNLFGFQIQGIGMYEKWCRERDKLLIFDNAATPIGRVVTDGISHCIQDVGNGAIVSLHETKIIGRGEGGAIFVDPDLAPFVDRAINFGFHIPEDTRIPNRTCSNWRMSDFHAAVICDFIDHMVENDWKCELDRLSRCAVEYLEHKGLKLALPIQFPTIISCLPVEMETPEQACSSMKLMHGQGVEAKKYYQPLVSLQEAPRAWELYNNILCLPFHMGTPMKKICETIDLLALEADQSNPGK